MTTSKQSTKLMQSILDLLMPPVEDLAGAGGLNLGDELHRMSIEHSKYTGVIERSIDAVTSLLGTNDLNSHVTSEVIQQFESSDPELFELLLEIVYTAYYSDTRVHERIGWKSGALQPDGHPMPPWNESILEIVRKREPFWTRVD